VGFPLAEYLLDDDVRLIVTDIDKGKVDRLQLGYGLDLVTFVAPDEICTVDAKPQLKGIAGSFSQMLGV
jgi:hypothetical protein